MLPRLLRSRFGAKDVPHLGDVLVPAAGEIDQHGRARSQLSVRPTAAITQASAWADSSAGRRPSVRARRWNASRTSAVPGRLVAGAPDLVEMRVLGPDARVVEAGRDRGRLEDLAGFVLDQRARASRGARRWCRW